MNNKQNFSQIKYVSDYNRENYKQLKVYLKPEEKQKIDNICKINNISKREFLLKSIEFFNNKNKKC